MKGTIEKRIDELMILTTTPLSREPYDRYYNHYKKYDDDGRPIVNSIDLRCIEKRLDKTIGWPEYIEKELKRLTDDWLQGDAAELDLQELVLRYQAGELKYYDAIKYKLETKVNYIINHKLGKRHAVFVRLDGKSAKSPKRGRSYIPAPGDDDYNKNEIQQIDAIFEERFTEEQLQRLVNKSLIDSLNKYKPGKKTFKSYFGDTFGHDVINYKNDCKDYWQQKPKKANWEAYEQKHKEAGRVWDYSTLYENYPGDYIDRLNDEQKRLLNVRVTAGAETLFQTKEAAALGVKEGKRNNIQGELEREYITWLKDKNIKIKIVTDKAPTLKANCKPTTEKKVCSWVGVRHEINNN